MKKYAPYLKWVIWALTALFYFYEYLLRISPSVMVPELMRAFSADAGMIGILGAFYLYAYSPMQLPVGLLMDRFGVRKLLTFASIVSGIGGLIFGLTHTIWIAGFGRLLIGVGSSFAFVAMVYVCSHWFPKKKQALMIGLANSLAMLGAVFGAGPLSVAVQVFDWRYVLIILGFFGLILALIFYFIIHHEPKNFATSDENRHILKYLKLIACNKLSWVNAFVAVFFYMTTTVLGELWGVPFLQQAYGWDRHQAGFAMSMLFLGWMVGGPLIGHLSDRMQKRQNVLSLSILATLILVCALLYLQLSPILVYLVLFGIGLFSAAELLNFSYAIEINSIHAKGTAVAFTNCLIAFMGALMQPLIGYLLVFGWKGEMSSGVPLYLADNYRHALSSLPILLLIGLFLSFFLNERRFHKTADADKSFT